MGLIIPFRETSRTAWRGLIVFNPIGILKQIFLVFIYNYYMIRLHEFDSLGIFV